jgi:hypothetical protein
MGKPSNIDQFILKDCALAAIATGRRAQNLRELRDQVQIADGGSIYYHFWGSLLRPDFDDPEYNNDFASWARHALHDVKLAEQLGVIDPADYPDIEGLRQELLEIIERRLDETEFLTWAKRDQQFHFVRSQIVVFDTGRRFSTPQELTAAMPTLSLGSIYYHVIDARRREPIWVDDFRAWLGRFGDSYADVCKQLEELDPYFNTLAELRVQLASIMNTHQPQKVAV